MCLSYRGFVWRVSVLCVLLQMAGILNVTKAFNVDTINFVRHRGAEDSMFGFSVALHQHNGASWVLVGAPQSQTQQPGVDRGGSVFRCSVVSDDGCQQLPFDTKGNNNDSLGQQIDQKSRQWLGATVSSTGIDGPVVACAPRYTWFSTGRNRREPVGTCYVATADFSQYSEYSPCRTRNWGYHRQGSCQAGLGAAVSKDGRRLFIGSPGSWYWQGQLYSVNPTVALPFIPPRYKEYGEGQLHQQSLDSRPASFQTPEGPAVDDDSYLGYSVAVGDFTGEGDGGVAVGMPRGAGLFGKVILYTWDLKNHQNISGEQLGAYFGYSIAVADIDGDDFDDLIIGAPLYTDLNNNEGKYETGRVYVLYQRSDQGRFRKLHRLDGVNSKARFGLALTTLGDINLDNFDDFAVGAPYDGRNERGAVYIYHGSADGVRSKPSQVIFAEDLSETSLYTFGFSLSGGIDLDNNEYPDLAVGAYDSNKIILFRSRPVVKVDAKVVFSAYNKQISLEETNCTLKNRERVPCTSINTCIQFTGVNVDRYIDLEVQYILDSKKIKNPRMFFHANEGRNVMNKTLRLERSNRICESMFVYIKNGVRDKLTPLEVEMRYSMYDRSSAASYAQVRNNRAPLLPILDQSYDLTAKDSITIQKNCGGDNICIPDLRLIATPSVNKYLLGSKDSLKIEVEVQNEGEDAFEAMFNMKMPPGINFKKIERLDSSQTEIPITCSAPSSGNNNTLKCDIGNPLPREKLVHFNVILEPYHEVGMNPSYDFHMEVNTTNPENNSLSDNFMHLAIGIWVETDFTIEGVSKPQELYINSTEYSEVNIIDEAQLGPQVIHIYNIRNKGPSDIEEAEVFFAWPMKTIGGDTLLYMLDEPETAGRIKCEYVNAINEHNLKLERRKSYLQSSGIATAGYLTSSYFKTGSSGVVVEESISSGSSSSFNKKNKKKFLTAEERRKYDEDEYGEETGDASDVHTKRIQEKTSQHHGSNKGTSSEKRVSVIGGNTGGGKIITEKHEYSSNWNSSQVNGGPVQTTSWSRNASWVTGPDGITRHSEQHSASPNFGVSSDNVRHSIHYTSSRVGSSGSRQQSGHSGGISESESTRGTLSGAQGRTSMEQGGSVTYESGGYRSKDYHKGAVENRFGESQTDKDLFAWNKSQNRGGTSREIWTDERVNPKFSGSGSQSNFEEHRSYDTHKADTTRTPTHYNQGYSSETRGTSTHSAGTHGQVGATNARNYGSQSVSARGGSRTSGENYGRGESSFSAGGRTSGDNVYGRVETSKSRSGTSEESYNRGSSRQGSSSGVYSSTRVESASGENARGRTASGDGTYVRTGNVESTYGKAGSGESIHGRTGSMETSHGRTGSVESTHGRTGSEENIYGRTGSGERTYGKVGSSERTYGKAESGEASFGRTGSVSGESSYGRTGASAETRGHNRESYGRTAQNHSQSSGRNRSTYGKYDHRDYDPALGLGNAALGGGFRTTSLDIGQLGPSSDSVNKDLSRHSGERVGGSTHYSASYSSNSGERLDHAGGTYDPDLGYSRSYEQEYNYGSDYGNSEENVGNIGNSRENARNDRTHSSSGGTNYYKSSSSRTESKFYTSGEVTERNISPSNYESRSSSYHSRDYVVQPDQKVDINSRFTLYNKRYKRSEERSQSDADIEAALTCKATQCAIMRCMVGSLTKDEPEAWVVFRARVNATTIKKVGGSEPVNFSTMMVARISKLPYIGKPTEQPVKSHEVFTTVVYNDSDSSPDVVPLWVVVLSAVAGTIILLLLIYLLYKCGFFKRNRPTDAPERQPLNRNGHYQNGDEAL